MELVFETAGESHGAGLTAILAGIPCGSPVEAAYVNARLASRQLGRGRSSRQKTEQDRVQFLAGVRDERATGNPIALQVANKDETYKDLPPVHAPRPGHADLPGALNRGLTDVRDVIERASARETAVRVAGGAVAAQLLEALGIHVLGHAVAIAGIDIGADAGDDLESARARRDASEHHALGDADAQAEASARIDKAKRDGDTLGGIVEVVASGVPAGLGGHERPQAKLTSGLAAAVMGIQAVRGVEFGLGFRAASLPGSQVHDAIVPGDEGLPARASNLVGGIEGGTSNGEPIVLARRHEAARHTSQRVAQRGPADRRRSARPGRAQRHDGGVAPCDRGRSRRGAGDRATRAPALWRRASGRGTRDDRPPSPAYPAGVRRVGRNGSRRTRRMATEVSMPKVVGSGLVVLLCGLVVGGHAVAAPDAFY